jgi:hypothetical protein
MIHKTSLILNLFTSTPQQIPSQHFFNETLHAFNKIHQLNAYEKLMVIEFH